MVPINGCKQYVKRHAGLWRAEQFIALAKRSVGFTQALHAYKLHVGQLLEEYTWQRVDLRILSMNFITSYSVFLMPRRCLAKPG